MLQRLDNAAQQPGAGQMDLTIIDQGRFAFLEFEEQHTNPSDRPVIAGIHALQILPTSLAGRSLHFPPMNAALQVRPQ